MGKIFKVDGKMALEIVRINAYWYYYDSGYHHISLYIKGTTSDITSGLARAFDWRYCDSHSTHIEEQIKSEEIYEFKIEHHDYDYITKAYDALIKLATNLVNGVKNARYW
jgi:hypothetical protein